MLKGSNTKPAQASVWMDASSFISFMLLDKMSTAIQINLPMSIEAADGLINVQENVVNVFIIHNLPINISQQLLAQSI